MRFSLLLIPLTLIVAPLAAQDLAVEPQASDAAQQGAADLFDSLSSEYQAAMEDWMKEARAIAAAAEESGAKSFDFPERPDGEFLPRFQKAAEQFTGTEGAVPFLSWILQNSGRNQDAAKAALKTIAANHIASKELESIAGTLPYLNYMVGAEEAKVFIAKLEKNSASPFVKAVAAYSLRAEVLKSAPIGSAEYKKARAEVMELAKMVKGDNAKMLDDMVLSEIKVREQFATGNVAPDISGIDLDGVEFKLSDYMGKVIMVDFWGDW
jgi:hypothetical protein